MQDDTDRQLSALLLERISAEIAREQGWLAFDRFMQMALYEPGLGYYANDRPKFGRLPQSGSDFVTAPELSPLFARALAVQVRQALDACACDEVWELGAGTGVLAQQLIGELGSRLRAYHIVEVSASLRERQAARLQPWRGRLHWHEALPLRIEGVVLGNEVLDAMPVKLLRFDGASWLERGVGVDPANRLCWRDRRSDLRPPVDCGLVPGTVTEIHLQARAFARSLASRLHRGCVFFFDYGFPEAEYYHPQRIGGTLMCHRGHCADDDPLADVGLKDITAHVNFSDVALTAQEAGLQVLGYTTQARFLINCGFAAMLRDVGPREAMLAQRLIQEHEMGELFKAVALAQGVTFDPIGFVTGDRSHRL